MKIMSQIIMNKPFINSGVCINKIFAMAVFCGVYAAENTR